MAPRALFDKSFLQAINVDESTLFDNFFYTVIAPIFYVETLADLAKSPRPGRTAEEEVSSLADKTPEVNSAPTVYHRSLGILSLVGGDVPMDGKMLMDGPPIRHGKLLSVLQDAPKEAEAYERWRAGEFLEVERRFAKSWRERLNGIDLIALAAAMRSFGVTPQNCRSLEEAKVMADSLVANADIPALIKVAVITLGADRTLEEFALARWRESGQKSFPETAPYAAYLVTVEVFFQIALAADQIGANRKSNRTDMAYLFYLPFCNIFVSSDRLHERCAPQFLRGDQRFVWGPDLKEDLKRLAARYKKLPEDEQRRGLVSFAPTPPRDDEDGLIAKLWDMQGRDWRKEREPPPPQLIKGLEELIAKAPVGKLASSDEIKADISNVGMLRTNRAVRLKKGSFWQGPADARSIK
jgi:hypothetical protein